VRRFPTERTPGEERCSHTRLLQLRLNAWGISEFLVINLLRYEGFCSLEHFSTRSAGCPQPLRRLTQRPSHAGRQRRGSVSSGAAEARQQEPRPRRASPVIPAPERVLRGSSRRHAARARSRRPPLRCAAHGERGTPGNPAAGRTQTAMAAGSRLGHRHRLPPRPPWPGLGTQRALPAGAALPGSAQLLWICTLDKQLVIPSPHHRPHLAPRCLAAA